MMRRRYDRGQNQGNTPHTQWEALEPRRLLTGVMSAQDDALSVYGGHVLAIDMRATYVHLDGVVNGVASFPGFSGDATWLRTDQTTGQDGTINVVSLRGLGFLYPYYNSIYAYFPGGSDKLSAVLRVSSDPSVPLVTGSYAGQLSVGNAPASDSPSFDITQYVPAPAANDLLQQAVSDFVATFNVTSTGLHGAISYHAGSSLLDNDRFYVVTGAAPTATVVQAPAHGQLVEVAPGRFSYTPGAGFSGTDSFTYSVSNGVVTSAPATVSINVLPVNDAPSFSGGPDVVVAEDSGPRTIAAWATNLAAGPADEAAQHLTFAVSANSNPGLFSVAPAVDPGTGTLTFTPAPNATGSATVSLVLKDDGWTANGGADTSAVQTFTITVNPINDAPSFAKGADVGTGAIVAPRSFPAWATAISPGGGSYEAGQHLAFTVVGNTDSSLFSSAPVIDAATGTLTFTPAAGATGTATVSVALSDDGGTTSGGIDTSEVKTFTITIRPAPAANVAALDAAALGPAVVAGNRAAKAKFVNVTVANPLATKFSGPVTIKVMLSPTSGAGGDIVIGQVRSALKLLPGQSRSVKVKATVPAGVPEGDYRIVSTLTGAGITVEGDTAAQAAGTVNVRRAYVELHGPSGVPRRTVQVGRAAALEIPVTNTGSVAASGPVRLTVYAMPPGHDQALPFKRLSMKLNIAPGATQVLRIPLGTTGRADAGDWTFSVNVVPLGALTSQSTIDLDVPITVASA